MDQFGLFYYFDEFLVEFFVKIKQCIDYVLFKDFKMELIIFIIIFCFVFVCLVFLMKELG